MMGGFGDFNLGVKLGIVLGSLIAVVFIAGLIKVSITRRWTERKRIEEASRPADKEKLVQKELNEGNLFGVRAIQHGYYGGVSQSRPSSPSLSYRLAPEAPLVDWGKEGKLGSSASSISSVPKARMKQSPLRIDLQDATFNPSSVGGIGGSYIPPSTPSIRSYRMGSPSLNDAKPEGWVSPLDVHFSRPSTPGTPGTPGGRFATLNTPTTGRPNTFGKPGTLMAPAVEVRSEGASVASSGLATPAPALLKTPAQPMPPTARSVQKTPIRAYLPADDHPSVRFQTPSVPLKDLPSPINVGDLAKFPSDHQHWRPASPDPSTVVVKARWRNAAAAPTLRQWLAESPTAEVPPSPISGAPTLPLNTDADLEAQWDRSQLIIRNSAAGRRVSIVKPEVANQTGPNANRNVFQAHEQLHNSTSSNMYAAPISSSVNHPFPTRMSSQTASIVLGSSASTPASSQEHTPQATPHHDRSISDESFVLGNSHANNNSPERTSPFSNSHATSDHSHSHSNNSSSSSYLSTTSSPTRSPANANKSQTSLLDLENFPFPVNPRQMPQSPMHGIELALPPFPSAGAGNSLQVNRPMSGQSRVSMGDFYDSYYADADADVPVPALLSPGQGRLAAVREQSRFL